MKQLLATRAFITYNGKLLIIRESATYQEGTNRSKYDAPGGRVSPGEHVKNALMREVREETGLDVTIGRPFHIGEWRPLINNEELQIIGIFYECFATTDDVILSEDHDEFLWIDPVTYSNYIFTDGMREALPVYMKFISE